MVRKKRSLFGSIAGFIKKTRLICLDLLSVMNELVCGNAWHTTYSWDNSGLQQRMRRIINESFIRWTDDAQLFKRLTLR